MIKNLLGEDDDSASTAENTFEKRKREPQVISLFDDTSESEGLDGPEDFIITRAKPQSAAETARNSGLAFSAGIVFFSAIVFMLVIGWGADLLLGSSPWGKVIGIVVGSLIGFIQFFRISSQIFKK